MSRKAFEKAMERLETYFETYPLRSNLVRVEEYRELGDLIDRAVDAGNMDDVRRYQDYLAREISANVANMLFGQREYAAYRTLKAGYDPGWFTIQQLARDTGINVPYEHVAKLELVEEATDLPYRYYAGDVVLLYGPRGSRGRAPLLKMVVEDVLSSDTTALVESYPDGMERRLGLGGGKVEKVGAYRLRDIPRGTIFDEDGTAFDKDGYILEG